MTRRIVITGIGWVTPLGNDKDKVWEALCNGESGVGLITLFDTTNFTSKIAAEVKDFQPQNYLDKKDVKKMDRFTQFAVASSLMAVKDANLQLDQENREKIGVLVGSGIGGISTLENQYRRLLEGGPSKISPFLIPMMILNIASGQISIYLGIKGPNLAISTACATAAHALGESAEIIIRNEADIMIAGGSEAAITPLGYGGFCAMNALSIRNDEPKRASRPFDAQRDGFVMGEGGGVLILEELQHALKRGAYIYAELVGYGLSGDAYHITAPESEGTGAIQAMKMALEKANLKPEDIDYINAHGTSTPLGDKIETIAIKKLFGQHAYKIAVGSTKSMTGHLLGAAGSVEAIICALAIQKGKIPPTINLENSDPDCDLDYIPNKMRTKDVKVALSNSFGFGGHNAVLILEKFSK